MMSIINGRTIDHLFPIIKQRNDQQQDNRLNHKSPHIKGEQVANFKFGVNAIQINGQSDCENNCH